MDRGAWQATVHGVIKESDTTERLKSNNSIPSGNKLHLPHRSSAAGYLSCSPPPFFTILSHPAMSISVQVFMWTHFHFF